MTLLDTDHVTLFHYENHPRGLALQARLQAAAEQPPTTTVISVEEQLRGWLAEIGRWREVRNQIVAYEKLANLFHFFSGWRIVHFDALAAEEFERLRKQRIRIGTLDLKIAAIALVHDAILLSANLSDYRKVPGLRVENWPE